MPDRVGIGDLVAVVTTNALGIEPCPSCEGRRVAMNEWSRKYLEYVPERLRERLGLERVTTVVSSQLSAISQQRGAVVSRR